MIRLILVSYHLLLLVMSAQTQDVKQFTPAQLKEDLHVFKTALEEAHPGLLTYQSKKEMEARFASIEKKLNSNLTELEFYRLLNPFVSNIRCAHTKFHREGKPDDPYAFHQKGLFPLKLYFAQDEKAYVVSSFTADKSLRPGVEVARINGKTIKEIKDVLFRQINGDGHVTSSKYAELNQFFPGYYANFMGAKDHYTIEYKEHKEKWATKNLAAASLAQVQQEATRSTSNSPFHLSFPEPGVALMKIDVFMAAENEFENFLSASFNELKTKNTTHLIIDLRDNEGGMDRFGARLYAWLANAPFHYYERLEVAGMPTYSFARYASLPGELEGLKSFIKKVNDKYLFTQHPNLGLQNPEQNAFKGNLYILQNGRSLSVTSEFAAIVKDHNRGVFIGEESGGTISGNNSGGFAMVTLPNTRLGLDIPLLRYVMNLEGKHPRDRGILPDHPVTISVQDVLQKNDPVLQKAYQLIHAKE